MAEENLAVDIEKTTVDPKTGKRIGYDKVSAKWYEVDGTTLKELDIQPVLEKETKMEPNVNKIAYKFVPDSPLRFVLISDDEKEAFRVKEALSSIDREDIKVVVSRGTQTLIETYLSFYEARTQIEEILSEAGLVKQAGFKVSAKALTEEAQDFISKHIKKWMDEGVPQDQAIAKAYTAAREQGYDVPEQKAAGNKCVLEIFAADDTVEFAGDKDDFTNRDNPKDIEVPEYVNKRVIPEYEKPEVPVVTMEELGSYLRSLRNKSEDAYTEVMGLIEMSGLEDEVVEFMKAFADNSFRFMETVKTMNQRLKSDHGHEYYRSKIISKVYPLLLTNPEFLEVAQAVTKVKKEIPSTEQIREMVDK